jgi:hypothetical protein
MVRENKSSKWFGWLAGSWICVILSFPMMANEVNMTRLNNFISLAQGQGVKAVLLLLFWQNPGDYANALEGDSYFGYGEVIVIALGLAFFFAKPNWKSFFVLIAAVFGFLPNAFLLQAHTGRILGCIAPFLLLGALGLNAFLNGLLLLPKGRVFYLLGCVLLLGFWGWSAQATVSRIYDQWSERVLSKHVLASEEAYKDKALGYRIYFVGSLFNRNAYPLNDGNNIHLWSPPNVIDLAPNDKPQDVVLFLEPDSRNEQGQLLRDQITKDFPTAQWTELRSPAKAPTDAPILLRCFMPWPDIAAYSQKYLDVQAKALKVQKRHPGAPGISAPPPAFFEVRPAPMPYWDRQYSTGQFGLPFDLIDYEDKVSNAGVSSPKAGIGEAVRYEGVIHVDGGGNYEMNWKTSNRTEFRVDGRTLLNLYFPRTGKFISPEKRGMKTIHLDAGDHKVEVTTCFQQNCDPPGIFLHREGTPGQGQPLWSSFNF